MRNWIKALVAVCLCYAAPARSVDYVWQNPSHGPFHWWEISVTTDGFYVPAPAVLLRSTNAQDWRIHYQSTAHHLFSIAQSPDKLLAVASNTNHPLASPGYPAFLISTNGVDFKFLKDAPHHVYKIAYGNGRFVAAGFEMSQSQNGVDWQRVKGVQDSNVLQAGDLLFGNGRFLRATPDGVYTSTNGIDWTRTGPPADRLSYHNGVYAAAGFNHVNFSTNGHTWQSRPVATPDSIRAMAIGPPGTVVVGDGYGQFPADAIFSDDGTNWFRFDLPFTNRPWDIKFINGRYLMVGDGGLLAYSTNGTNWVSNSALPLMHIQASAQGDGRVLAVGTSGNREAAGMWTTNGVTWLPINFPVADGLTAVAYGNGAFVGVGWRGQVLVSTNGGDSWTAPPRFTTGDFYMVTTSARGFVASNWEGLFVSSDGLTWEKVPVANFRVGDIAYGNGVYIAIAIEFYQTGALISRDLQTWEYLPEPYRESQSVEFANGRFVLGAPPYASTDGTNWLRGDHNSLLFGLSYSEGFFTAGYYSNVGLVSRDGLRWHRVFDLPQVAIRPRHYFGRFIGFTPYGGIVEAENFAFLDLSRYADGSLTLQPIQPANFTTQIESSPDLISWSPHENQFPGAAPRQYFRLKSDQPPAGQR